MNDLVKWMEEERHTCRTFSKELEKKGYKASVFTVQSWRLGQIPKRQAWPFIEAATEGKVRASSFI